MRNGYILLHRKGITEAEWLNPLRTLAWIDLCTLAACEETTTKDGTLQRGEVFAEAEFLADRWRQSPETVRSWLLDWELEGRTQSREGKILLLVNYDKYQCVTHTSKRKVTKGPHPAVCAILTAMRECFGDLDDSEARNRQYAWHLFRKARKLRPESSADEATAACVSLIRAASLHEFWGARITKVENIYKNAKRITQDLRAQSVPRVLSADI